MAKPESLRALLRRNITSEAPLSDLLLRVEACCNAPLPEDLALIDLARRLELTTPELAAIATAALADEDPLFAAELTRLQTPAGRGRPLLGFLALRLAGASTPTSIVLQISSGAALAAGLLDLHPESAPLGERALSLPAHVLHALNGLATPPQGITTATLNVPLPAGVEKQALRHAQALRDSRYAALAIRAATVTEARSAARSISKHLQRQPAFIESAAIRALGPWLHLSRCLPVHVVDLAPGDTRNIETPKGYSGPQIIVAPLEGTLTVDSAPIVEWQLAVPSPHEREALWRDAVTGRKLAHQLAAHRHSSSRIAGLSRLMTQLASTRRASLDDFYRAAWTVERHSLGHLALPIEDEVADDALVLPPDLLETFELLLARCRHRDGLDAGLGSSARTRYRAGVRALLAGPPGTGKTLAAGWLAAQLKMPLFRIDLAAISSKYIGDMEKNLSRLLNQAEQSEVVLLFDEADAIFAKRTVVTDSNDRFANAQTSYLLQRIEAFDGIAILTSNDDSSMDPAFTRRLDFIIEFRRPASAERRGIWLGHLGEHHTLTPEQINRLSSAVELSGGDIRNVVFHAAVAARERGGKIAWPDIMTGVRLELKKLRRALPAELAAHEKA